MRPATDLKINQYGYTLTSRIIRQPCGTGLLDQLFKLAVEFRDMGDKQSTYTADEIKFRYFLFFPFRQYYPQGITGTEENDTVHQIAAPTGPAIICCFNGAAFLVGMRKGDAELSRQEEL